ncbi:hypothetical protein ACM66B_001430 [Microbotryomycetes sp. NB124-2]
MANTSFVPLSLADALTTSSASNSSRMYMSAQAAAATSSSSSSGRRASSITTTPLGAASGASARMKARTMLKTLGIQEDAQDDDEAEDERIVDSTSSNDAQPRRQLAGSIDDDLRDETSSSTVHERTPVVASSRPRPSSMIVHGTSAAVQPTPATSSTTAAADVQRLRKQIESLQSDKKVLKQRVEALERDKRQWQAREDGLQAELTKRLGGNVKLEELEQSFASQEALLAGYQRDAEKSFVQIDTLKRQLRRLTDFLSDHFGSSWENDLNLSLDLTKPATRQTFASPVVDRRTLQADRHAQQQKSIVEEDERGIAQDVARASEPRTQTQEPPSNETIADSTARQMTQHLERTEALLDAITIRLSQRDERLKRVESRAKQESERAWAEVDVLKRKLAELEERDS